MGAGHRLTLWQVPEVCNLLRHLKNVTRNVFLEGPAYPTVTMAVEGKEGSPRGIREGCGLFQEATRMFSLSSGRGAPPLAAWVSLKNQGRAGRALLFCFCRPGRMDGGEQVCGKSGRPALDSWPQDCMGLLSVICVRKTTRKRKGPF